MSDEKEVEKLKKNSEEDFNITVRFEGVEQITPIFVNQLGVQQLPHGEFTVNFFQLIPPLVETDEHEKKIRKEGISAKCVSRVVLSRIVFTEMLRLMLVQTQHFMPTAFENLVKEMVSEKIKAEKQPKKRD